MRKILIVEDDQSIRVLLKLYLVRLSHQLLEARNGLEGLSMAKQFEPDLIITDLAMPVMDGVKLVTTLRAHPKLKDVPVVVLTGTSAEVQQKANDMGATAVLTKPINRRDLVGLIDQILLAKAPKTEVK